ncbi:hypothetical protein CSKR_200533 [Clonorchis sinensis]|uniref:Uncharacterized protein n=1 Tax=Clonorchis sinensis TaxID=79923 RepID=A0A8T1MDT3_CLOSI|nr:hypothetical protein CSKR_200533 [Clonorchis sinensis]
MSPVCSHTSYISRPEKATRVRVQNERLHRCFASLSCRGANSSQMQSCNVKPYSLPCPTTKGEMDSRSSSKTLQLDGPHVQHRKLHWLGDVLRIPKDRLRRECCFPRPTQNE